MSLQCSQEKNYYYYKKLCKFHARHECENVTLDSFSQFMLLRKDAARLLQCHRHGVVAGQQIEFTEFTEIERTGIISYLRSVVLYLQCGCLSSVQLTVNSCILISKVYLTFVKVKNKTT